MKKFTFMLLALLTMVFTGAYAADEATFDFNAMDVEVSTNSSHDGDITTGLTLTEGDVTLVVSPSTTTTANRFWGTNNGPQLRVYSGTLTFSVPTGKNITKMVFNNAKWNAGNAANTGDFDSNTWEGEANAVVVTIAGNTQLNSIEVTVEEDANNPTPVPVNIVEKIAITPAQGTVTSLQNFQITFDGEVVTVNEDAVPTLGDLDGGIGVSDDGKTVFVDFEEAITAAGNYTLNIPAGAISYNGTALDPLSFNYNIVGLPDYTISPAPGTVKAADLAQVTITFNNYMVEVADEEEFILYNTENDTEIAATSATDIAGKRVLITFPEDIAAGDYALIVMDGAIQKTIDGTAVGEMEFAYTVEAESTPVDPTPGEGGEEEPADEDYTIDPVGVQQESLGLFFITFNNYTVKGVTNARATLTNLNTDEVREAYVLDVDNGKKLYLRFEETTEPGYYTLTVPEGAVVKADDESVLPEMSFSYVIPGANLPFYDHISIDPAEGQVESLQQFTINFPAVVGEIANGAVATLTNTTNGNVYELQMTDAGQNVILYGLDEAVTEPGNYTLSIPQGAVVFYNQGDDFVLDPLQFNYSIVPSFYDLISINPAEGEVESLEQFTITFPAVVGDIAEGAVATLTNTNTEAVYELEMTSAGQNVILYGIEAVTEPGNYTLDIPEGAVVFYNQGDDFVLDPLQFRFNIAGPDYTIDPAEGEVESLGAFTLTFNNYLVEVNSEEAVAILFNTETNEEIEAGYIGDIAGGKKVYISFPEVTTPGEYELIIMDGAIQKTIDGSFLPELSFRYTIVSNGPQLVTLPEGVEPEEWTMDGIYYSDGNYSITQTTQVAFDGNDVYVQGLAVYFPEAWVKGTINGDRVVFASGQFVGEDEYGEEYIIGYDYSDIADFEFAYDADARTLTMVDGIILENGAVDELAFWGYWRSLELRAGAYVEPTVVEVPEDLVAEDYLNTYMDYDGEDATSSIKIGIDGDDVYVQGLSKDFMPEAWIKGTFNEDHTEVTFPGGQYLGNYYGMADFWFMDYDVTFTYDAETEQFATDNVVYTYYNYNGNTIIDEGAYYVSPVFTKVVEMAATPADPEITAINSSSWGDILYFNIPTVDVDGNGLVPSKLSYVIYSDVEGEVSPVTLTADDYPYLEEDMTEIPYGFTEEYDIYVDRLYLNMEHSDWNRVGIKSIYRGGNEENETEIQWYFIKDYEATGIDSLTADSNASYFDLQGRPADKNARGLLIKQTRQADGTVKTAKVIRK